MILVPGRSQRQGTSLNEGKLKEEYKRVTSTAELNEKGGKGEGTGKERRPGRDPAQPRRKGAPHTTVQITREGETREERCGRT